MRYHFCGCENAEKVQIASLRHLLSNTLRKKVRYQPKRPQKIRYRMSQKKCDTVRYYDTNLLVDACREYDTNKKTGEVFLLRRRLLR